MQTAKPSQWLAESAKKAPYRVARGFYILLI
jgi:hypothetical protein